MLKKLLYLFLCFIPLLNMAMEESRWVSSNPSATLFASIRGALKQESPKGILDESLENELNELEKKYFQVHKINMTTYKHYSAVTKVLFQLNNAAQYKGAIANILAQYYWKQYGPELMQDGIHMLSQNGLSILAENGVTATQWLLNFGLTVGTRALQTGQQFLGKEDTLHEDLTMSGVLEVKPVIASIESTKKNNSSPLIEAPLSGIKIPKTASIFSVIDDSMYVKNRKFDGFLIADEIFFIASEKYNNGESDIDFLVHLLPDADLLDLSGFHLDLEELLNCKVDVIPDNSIHWSMKDQILSQALSL